MRRTLAPTQLVRVRSPEGNFRFELQPEDDFTLLVQKVSRAASSKDLPRLAEQTQRASRSDQLVTRMPEPEQSGN